MPRWTPTILTLLLVLLIAPLLHAEESASADCARARDPARCEARQAALVACAEKRGAAKQTCFESYMPPVDCSRDEDPAHCEAIEHAKTVCKGKLGKALKSCMKGHTSRRSAKSPAAAKARHRYAHHRQHGKKKPNHAARSVAATRASKASSDSGRENR